MVEVERVADPREERRDRRQREVPVDEQQRDEPAPRERVRHAVARQRPRRLHDDLGHAPQEQPPERRGRADEEAVADLPRPAQVDEAAEEQVGHVDAVDGDEEQHGPARARGRLQQRERGERDRNRRARTRAQQRQQQEHREVEHHLDHQRPRDAVHRRRADEVVGEREREQDVRQRLVLREDRVDAPAAQSQRVAVGERHRPRDEEQRDRHPQRRIDAQRAADRERPPRLALADVDDDEAADHEEQRDAEGAAALHHVQRREHPALDDRRERHVHARLRGPDAEEVVVDDEQRRDRADQGDAGKELRGRRGGAGGARHGYASGATANAAGGSPRCCRSCIAA